MRTSEQSTDNNEHGEVTIMEIESECEQNRSEEANRTITKKRKIEVFNITQTFSAEGSSETRGQHKEKNAREVKCSMGQKLNRVNIVKMNQPEVAKFIPETLHTKISKTWQLLRQGNFNVEYEPIPTAWIFTEVRRGPFGLIRRALRRCLPSWAFFGLDFISAAGLEIVTDARLEDRVVTTLQVVSISQITEFDLFKTALKSRTGVVSQEEKKRKNLEVTAYRLQKNVTEAKNKWAAKWYERMVQEAKKKLSSARKPSGGSGRSLITTHKVEGKLCENKAGEGWTLVAPKQNQKTGKDKTEGSN